MYAQLAGAFYGADGIPERWRQRLAQVLLADREDLIHKAVGWMLREVGKRDHQAEEVFLQVHYQQMPRVMLRYALEKFPEEKRVQYLKGEISSNEVAQE